MRVCGEVQADINDCDSATSVLKLSEWKERLLVLKVSKSQKWIFWLGNSSEAFVDSGCSPLNVSRPNHSYPKVSAHFLK